MADPPVDPAALKIVHYPAAVLRAVARPVPDVDDRVRAVAARMIDLMHEADGVGLAAPQVGLGWRLFVARPSRDPDDPPRVCINPVLKDPSRTTAPREEGCLSLPGIYAEITRPVGVTIEALDEHGQPFTLTSDELPARIWQHEFDHLEGVLIIDRMTPMDRKANQTLLREMEARR